MRWEHLILGTDSSTDTISQYSMTDLPPMRKGDLLMHRESPYHEGFEWAIALEVAEYMVKFMWLDTNEVDECSRHLWEVVFHAGG